jgi:hypothetical protein
MEILGEETVFDGQFITVKKVFFKGSDDKTYV